MTIRQDPVELAISKTILELKVNVNKAKKHIKRVFNQIRKEKSGSSRVKKIHLKEIVLEREQGKEAETIGIRLERLKGLTTMAKREAEVDRMHELALRARLSGVELQKLETQIDEKAEHELFVTKDTMDQVEAELKEVLEELQSLSKQDRLVVRKEALELHNLKEALQLNQEAVVMLGTAEMIISAATQIPETTKRLSQEW